MNCSNCNASLSCSCQRRQASDGKSCCSSCVGTYEKNLIVNGPRKPLIPSQPSQPSTQPNVWGVNRYVAPKK